MKLKALNKAAPGLDVGSSLRSPEETNTTPNLMKNKKIKFDQ